MPRKHFLSPCYLRCRNKAFGQSILHGQYISNTLLSASLSCFWGRALCWPMGTEAGGRMFAHKMFNTPKPESQTARGARRSVGSQGKGLSPLLKKGHPVMASTSTASFLHSGRHFFPPTLSPGRVSSNQIGHDVCLWSQNQAFCWPQPVQVCGVGMVSFINLSGALHTGIPSQPPGPSLRLLN